MDRSRYYDWQPTLSYDADLTIVVAERNIGKTFGLREQFIRDYLQREERFAQVCRYRNSIAGIAAGFFDKIMLDTKDAKLQEWRDEEHPCWRLENGIYQIGHVLENGKRTDWRTMGFFTHLSVKQASKERTFAHVRRICMDEAIIEPEDLRYRNYMPDEWGNLASIVSSVAREQKGIGHKPNVYLLANAADIINPWFRKLRIATVPKYGKHWYRNKTVLLDYVDPSQYDRRDDTDTVAGRMLADHAGGSMASANVFENAHDAFIGKRTRGAQYECAFIYRGRVYAIWTDWSAGLSFVSSKWIEGAGNMYALTTRDNRPNYLAAKESRRAMSQMIERYGYGLLRFENVSLREGFAQMMRDFGIR